ncbi:Hypothetical protein CINCED_3A010542 [Cinara cedri]|uniref:Uncharacterized protein n=1 Tax=Cinara cedri TaxID=506608 RepID=A0A5E4N5F3_9HEMI|nr:Hypothetical protein CINCED_3A010542 [Cinara cedri]
MDSIEEEKEDNDLDADVPTTAKVTRKCGETLQKFFMQKDNGNIPSEKIVSKFCQPYLH